jgi:hypothetical protein
MSWPECSCPRVPCRAVPVAAGVTAGAAVTAPAAGANPVTAAAAPVNAVATEMISSLCPSFTQVK